MELMVSSSASSFKDFLKKEVYSEMESQATP